MFALRGRLLLLLLQAKRQHTVSLSARCSLDFYLQLTDLSSVLHPLLTDSPLGVNMEGPFIGRVLPQAPNMTHTTNTTNFLLQFENEFTYSLKMSTFLICDILVLYYFDLITLNLNHVSSFHQKILSLFTRYNKCPFLSMRDQSYIYFQTAASPEDRKDLRVFFITISYYQEEHHLSIQ